MNEIFNPERTAPFFNEPAHVRNKINMANRNTNYGVVRLELLERIYETLYHQRLHSTSEAEWAHRILPGRTVLSVDTTSSDKIGLDIDWNVGGTVTPPMREHFEYDLVVLATGYRHNGHEDMLEPLRRVSGKDVECWTVAKDYRLSIDGLNISQHAGIWLQGCNEKTHGVSTSISNHQKDVF